MISRSGTVEYIGIKTTRLRATSGEQLIFSNTNLTNARVHNHKRMQTRRVQFVLGVVYRTPAEKLKRIPELVKQIITSKPDLTYDRGHFAAYGDFSLKFEFVYMVNTADYGVFMDRQQAIYFEIFEVFEREKIEFAYPTQEIQVQLQNGNDEHNGHSFNQPNVRSFS
jgi:small-conductance mechanosensitive channel